MVCVSFLRSGDGLSYYFLEWSVSCRSPTEGSVGRSGVRSFVYTDTRWWGICCVCVQMNSAQRVGCMCRFCTRARFLVSWCQWKPRPPEGRPLQDRKDDNLRDFGSMWVLVGRPDRGGRTDLSTQTWVDLRGRSLDPGGRPGPTGRRQSRVGTNKRSFPFDHWALPFETKDCQKQKQR